MAYISFSRKSIITRLRELDLDVEQGYDESHGGRVFYIIDAGDGPEEYTPGQAADKFLDGAL